MARRTMRFLTQLVLRSGFDEILERTLAAEAAGFAAVLVPDHFHIPPESGSGQAPVGIAESWTTLAGLAARTERIRIGGAVMCNNFRHPCLTAQIAATVDQISNGRLELGLGAGWMAEEFRRTGIAFPGPGERIAMLEEALAIILPALEGKSVRFSGRHYEVTDFALLPGAVQSPRPPLHIGGGGDKVLTLAARHADVVSLIPPARGGRVTREQVLAFGPERVRERIRFLRESADRHGRDPASIEVLDFTSVVNVTETEAEADGALAGMAKMFSATVEEIRGHPMTLVGTPDQIVASLEERRAEWDIDSVMLGSGSGTLFERFGAEIIPRLGV